MMKRFICVIVSCMLILTNITIAYALNSKATLEGRNSIELKISSSIKEIEFMKSFNGAQQFNYENEKNTLKINFNKKEKNGNDLLISGNGIVNLDGRKMTFLFENEKLFICEENGKIIYDGVIDISLFNGENTYEGILDLTANDDLNNVIASLTIIDTKNEKQSIIMFGETFKEQISSMQKVASTYDEEIYGTTKGEAISNAVKGGSKFHHVKNASSNRLNGVAQNKNFIVLSVAKYDPRCKKEESGSELLRVFTRSQNVLPFVDNAVKVIPYRIKADFACGYSEENSGKGPFLRIVNTDPQNSSNHMTKVFQILTDYIPGKAASLLANLFLEFSEFQNTKVAITRHLDTNQYTKVNFDVIVYDRLNIDAASIINLPTATVSSEAHKNEKNGVAFVVDYDEASTSGVGAYAKATCNASAEYRAILNSPSRTITVSTGTATCSHYVYGRDY